MRPIYPMPDAKLEAHGNRGLWYTRFFDRYDDGGTLGEDAKRSWVSDNARQTGDRRALDAHATRQRALIETLDGQTQTFATDWNFATGLGLPHPVENGLTWHHTLGVPYLPGSGVKGLLRAWVEGWDESLGALDSRERAERINDWFGTVNDRDGSGTAGRFVFFDALPIAPLQLTADVMTPHMGKWYEQGDVIGSLNDAERIPADWHDPVPVPFLVVKSARLQFGVAPRLGQSGEGLDEVLRALKQALLWLGAGAKTAAGYGRFTPTESSTSNGADAATIATGPETWKDALIEWQPDKGRLLAMHTSGKRSALSDGSEAKRLHASLSQSQLKKLKTRQLRRDVVVDVQGNQATIKNWASDAPAS